MSQVIVEFAQVAISTRNTVSPVSFWDAVSEEITSSGTAQATTLVTPFEPGRNVVTVINNGTDAIWIRFGGTATAASPSRFIAPNTSRDFGNVPTGVAVSVINDS